MDMNRGVLFFCFMLCAAPAFAAQQTAKSGAVDVYAGGSVSSRTHGLSVATVWKNGAVFQSLTKKTDDASVSSLAVSGSDVYAGGFVHSENGVATVWKNGAVFRRLPKEAKNAYVTSLAVSGSDVYAGGYESNERVEAATVWKNDKVLWRLKGEALVGSLAVSGEDIYAGGHIRGDRNGTSFAMVWKNGKELWRLTDGKRLASVVSLAVSGADVYAGVNEQNRSDGMDDPTRIAAVWKNGKVLWKLTDGARPASVRALAVSGSDVYAGGDAARVWKNGALLWKLPLTDGNGIVTSLAVSGSDVYAGGYQYPFDDAPTATVWKNGNLLWKLPNGKTGTSVIGALIVK
jgi:hypothetical protein